MSPQPTGTCPHFGPEGHIPTRELAALMLRSSPCPVARMAATTQYVISVWQNLGRYMTPTPPSLLLVNAGGASPDPVDAFAEEHYFSLEAVEEKLRKGEIVDREKSFAHAMGRRVIERKANGDPPSGEEDIATGADYFEEMRARDFGHGPAVRYCHARHSKYGWLSNWSNQLLLRIDRKEDRRAFLDDVLDGSPRLHQPDGIGRSMMLEMKTLCLSGTLDEEEWSEPVVSRLLQWGWPVIFLPHTVVSAPKAVSTTDIFLAFQRASNPRFHKIQGPLPGPYGATGPARLDHWKDHYLALLRGRLLHMPAAYDLQIRLILQVIDDVCLRMVLACLEKQDSVELIGVLALELSYTVQRAITIGVWALAYHGWGFPTVLPRQGVVALLDHLRSRGPAKMRDLQRRFSVSAKTCEAVVDCLQREGLVIRHKREVKAMPLAGYLDILHRCPEFEQISQVSAVLLGESLESRGITRKNIKATRRAYEREWNAANKPLGKAEPCAGTVSEAADDTQPAENQMVNGEDAPSQG